MHNFSYLFDKVLYMFGIGLLSETYGVFYQINLRNCVSRCFYYKNVPLSVLIVPCYWKLHKFVFKATVYFCHLKLPLAADSGHVQNQLKYSHLYFITRLESWFVFSPFYSNDLHSFTYLNAPWYADSFSVVHEILHIFMESVSSLSYSLEIPTRCSFVIEFIIPEFIEGCTCFERHTAHHQEL
jgi:hypothetical protein